MYKLKSFPPVIDSGSRVLVLGSMPGAESLRLQQYYANPRNQFWAIIYSLYARPVDPCYENRIQFVKRNRIALWDVIKSCCRAGSLDSNIEKETINDFEGLFNNFPGIKLIVFNGTKARDVYQKKVGFKLAGREYELLPSTSPANTMRFEDKLKHWSIIANFMSESNFRGG